MAGPLEADSVIEGTLKYTERRGDKQTEDPSASMALSIRVPCGDQGDSKIRVEPGLDDVPPFSFF